VNFGNSTLQVYKDCHSLLDKYFNPINITNTEYQSIPSSKKPNFLIVFLKSKLI